MNHPTLLCVGILFGLYVGRMWLADRRAERLGQPLPNALPGATEAPPRAVILAVAGGVLLVAADTWGEVRLGVAAEQSRMTWLFALYSILAAPLIEEIIFRGWLVVERRGNFVMWAAAFGASILFALLHPFLWRWDSHGFAFAFDTKGWFSTGVVMATSIWLYFVRLTPWNPRRSLLPCFAGHAAKNVAVVAVKAMTGYMAGLW